jgi:rubredoxin
MLCSDVCDVNGIEVREMEYGGTDLLLTRFECRACGVSTHINDAGAPDDGLCRVCRQTGHHKKLFVVLD